MLKRFMHAGAGLAAMAFSSTVLAHPGHSNGALAGLLHPLLGLDHLLTMLAVGIWASQVGGRAKWMVPVSFVACMALAAVAPLAGLALPLVEAGVAASVLLVGLMIAFSIRMEPKIGGALVAAFALFHGYAHGVEMPTQSSAVVYGAGFIISTALLHAAGMIIGGRLRHRGWIVPGAGSAIAAYGAWLFGAIA